MNGTRGANARGSDLTFEKIALFPLPAALGIAARRCKA